MGVPVNCAYCGALSAPTVDHVPPRSIFADPKPSTLRTVPSCVACNAGASADDEYFRDVVVKYYRVADLPQAEGQVAAMIRAASKPPKRKYAERTLASFRAVEIRTPAGLVLGKAPAFTVDTDRFYRAVRRYVRGLYQYDTATPMPRELGIEVIGNPDLIDASRDDVLAVLAGAEQQIVQEHVFWYAWQRVDGHPDVMIWLLVFFDAYPILCITGSPHEPLAV